MEYGSDKLAWFSKCVVDGVMPSPEKEGGVLNVPVVCGTANIACGSVERDGFPRLMSEGLKPKPW